MHQRFREREQEYDTARDIQRGLLPAVIPRVPGFQIACVWQPARAVGGDYYDVVPSMAIAPRWS